MQNQTCQKHDFSCSQDGEWTYLRRESGCRASKTFEAVRARRRASRQRRRSDGPPNVQEDDCGAHVARPIRAPNLGIKALRGWGWLTNPKRAVYSRVYSRTTFSFLGLLKALFGGRRLSRTASSTQNGSRVTR